MSARFDLRRQRTKTSTRVGQMMKHANGKGVIEFACEGKLINVRLNDVRVLKMASRGKSSLDRRAQINADDLACAPARRKLRVPTFAATAFKDNLVFEKLRLDGRYPS